MRAFFFQKWQKSLGVIFTAVILAALITETVAADPESDHSWFTAKVDRVTGNVCVGRQERLWYKLRFDGMSYCQSNRDKCGKKGADSDTGPTVDITPFNGTVNEKHIVWAKNPDMDVVAFYYWYVVFTPKKAGRTHVYLKTNFMGSKASDDWEFVVSDPCPMDLEIKGDQNSAKIKGKTVNEIQKSWSISMLWNGFVRILSDPLMNEGGSGGNERPAANAFSKPRFQDNTSTMDFVGDAIFLGAPDADLICGTKGTYTCTSEFSVHPIPNEETIDFQIDVGAVQCGTWTVWCKGSGGGGEATIPPITAPGYQMNAVIPREGGSTHVIQQFSHGVSIDYLISAFPVEGE